MDAQPFGHEEGRESTREDVEKRRGGWLLLGREQNHKILGADRVYIDPAAPCSATSFDQSKNFNKSRKILIDGVMSSDHIR